MASVPRLQEKYEKEILPGLAEKLGRKNRHSLPGLQKIVISMGVGSAVTEKKHLDMAISALTEITGQKPSVRREVMVAVARGKGRWPRCAPCIQSSHY